MKNLFRNNPGMILLLIAFSAISSLFLPSESHAQNITGVQGLNRVGPRNQETGYPLWYEDKNNPKLKLQLCLDPDNCFLETPDPLRALHMPTSATDPAANFPDESFFFAAESIFSGHIKGERAVLVQALEGMFFSDAGVIVDDQAVMSRIRIRIDGLTSGQQYTVIYPYGIETFLVEGDAGPGAAKGPGISMTRDIGLVEPLFFEGPLTGDIGPFLVTIDTPDGAGGVAPGYAPGDPFIGDGGLNEMMVTGSPLNIPGHNTNVFRIEGPGVGTTYPFNPCVNLTPIGPGPINSTADCAESFLFSVMGQIATKFGATIDRATYTKELVGGFPEIFVNVWANTVEGQALVATVDGGATMNLTEGDAGNYFGRLSVPADQIPQTVKVTNTTDNPQTSESSPIADELTIKEARYIVGTGLNVVVQSSNFIDTAVINASLISGQADPVVFNLNDQPNTGLAIGTNTLPTDPNKEPPVKVIVRSSYGGISETFVAVVGGAADNGPLNGVLAIAGVDQNVISDGRTVILNGSESLGPRELTYTWTQDPAGRFTFLDLNLNDPLPAINSAQTSFVTPLDLSDPDPLISGKLTVNFTLTVSDGINTHSDTVTVNMVQPATLADNECKFAVDPPVAVLLHLPGAPRYRINREKWIVEGSCKNPDNQVISIYLGGLTETAPKFLIGKTRVDALGNWTVAPGNRTATVEAGTIPIFTGDRDPRTPDDATSRLYLVLERGPTVSSTFTIN